MHELGLRLRVLADDLAFFGEVDFDFQVFQCHAIAEVAVQPVRLLHDRRAARSIFAEETHHRAKLLAAGNLAGLPANKPRATSNSCAWAYSRSSFNCAGME